ncbi:DNA-binding protein [Syncephalis fuscata]|nr:DNA-binding protein [Syncephalis fuscata]
MQAQMIRTKQGHTETSTVQSSGVLVKQLLLTGVTCIAYLRSFFDEDVYADDKYDGQSIKRLTRGKSSEADTMLDWIEIGCFEALDRRYLRSAVIGVYLDSSNPQQFAESYTFNIDYSDATSTASTETNGSELVKQNIKQLIRRLILLTQTLPPLQVCSIFLV